MEFENQDYYKNIQQCLIELIHNINDQSLWVFSEIDFENMNATRQIKALKKTILPETEATTSLIVLPEKFKGLLKDYSSIPSFRAVYLLLPKEAFLEYQLDLFNLIDRFAELQYFEDFDFLSDYTKFKVLKYEHNLLDNASLIARSQKIALLRSREIDIRQALLVDYKNQNGKSLERNQHFSYLLSEKGYDQELKAKLVEWQNFYDDLQRGKLWKMMNFIRSLRYKVMPHDSWIEKILKKFLKIMNVFKERGLLGFIQKLFLRIGLEINLYGEVRGVSKEIDPIQKPWIHIPAHTESVDIIICIHNALDDVKKCIESIVQFTHQPYHLILIDDGSDQDTAFYLENKALEIDAELYRSEEATGYTYAANRGLRVSSADFVVLLNSDTVVSAQWIDRMILCARSDEQIGVVGPLSNTASWQSVPKLEENGDWATNKLPAGVSVHDMAELVAKYSGQVYPDMPFLNGFCLLIRRSLIEDIGLFDEDVFGQGYGEEDDFALRAREAGWKLALADDVYIYHAQSKSYSNDLRKKLGKQAFEKLKSKHGEEYVKEGVDFCHKIRVLEGIRALNGVVLEREETIEKGKAIYAGKCILFILPITNAGGGGNVVISEAYAMQKMGVKISLFNLKAYEQKFKLAYPDLKLPVIYGESEDLLTLSQDFDAVIATYNPTVAWMENIKKDGKELLRGYYVQEFEPMMYSEGSLAYITAWDSYNKFPSLIRFTKTEWTRKMVLDKIGVDSHNIGVSLEVDLFQPRRGYLQEKAQRTINIVAMVRPESPYRAPYQTMLLLRKIKNTYKDKVNILIYGTVINDPGFQQLPVDFEWNLFGLLPPQKVSSLMNEADIFVDCSTHQAMGLAALEAMACGNAVIVPENGGSASIVQHGVDGLIVDTTSFMDMFKTLKTLIENAQLRTILQYNAIYKARSFFPEKTSFNILEVLFNKKYL